MDTLQKGESKMSTYISTITEEDIITCNICEETFDANEITTDDFNFAWDNLVTTDCCSNCFSVVKKEKV